MFYKIKTLKIPEYLYYLIPSDYRFCNIWYLDFVEIYFCRTDAFKYLIFPFSIFEWSKRDPDIHSAKSYSTFRKSLLKSGQASPKSCLQNP